MVLNKLLFNIDFQIEQIENKQKESIEIVKCLSILNVECEHSKLLEYHITIINDCDKEIDDLLYKKKIHEKLKDHWNIYVDYTTNKNILSP